MAATSAPITIKETLTLPSIGINPQSITFTNVTMESDKYICIRETAPQNSVVIIDMKMPMQPLRRPITADSALMNPNSRILALKAQLPGTTLDHLQIFNIEMKVKVKSHQMSEQVVFWKWISPKTLGLVTQTSVYHWTIEGDSEPVKMFERTANLANNQIINYRCDPNEKWFVLIGIAPGSPERPQLVKGNMQLFSVDQQRSQALEAHAASFATFKVPGNENPSTLISFATKSFNAGQITSKLHVIELGAQPGKPSFTKKQADTVFPPDLADDFPVSILISQKYGLIYVITKLGLLFVYDLETATAVYRNRISLDPIFLTTEASSIGGFYAINRRGQVLLATVNEATIFPFIIGQLNNLELAVNLVKRGNLAGAENLVKDDVTQISPIDLSTLAKVQSSTAKKLIESIEEDVDDDELEGDVFARMDLFSGLSIKTEFVSPQKDKAVVEEEEIVATPPTEEEIQSATSVLDSLIEGNKRQFWHNFPVIFRDFVKRFAEKEKAAEAINAAKKSVEDGFTLLARQKEEYGQVKEEINTQLIECQKLEEVLAQLEAQVSDLKVLISSKQEALAEMKIRRKQLLNALNSLLKKLELEKEAAEALTKKNQGISKELTNMQLEWKEWREFL